MALKIKTKAAATKPIEFPCLMVTKEAAAAHERGDKAVPMPLFLMTTPTDGTVLRGDDGNIDTGDQIMDINLDDMQLYIGSIVLEQD